MNLDSGVVDHMLHKTVHLIFDEEGYKHLWMGGLLEAWTLFIHADARVPSVTQWHDLEYGPF